MSKPKTPDTPDYKGAAQATSAGDLAAARATADANRVNQVTPYGNLTYTQTPSANPDSGWTATQTMSPDQQSILDKNNQLSIGLLGTASNGLDNVNSLLSDPSFNESKLAQMPIQGQSVQDAIMSRLQPQMDRQRGQMDTQLANQGIMRDSEAWKNAQTDQGQKENDLMTQAALQGINTGMASRQQGIQEQAYMQDRPLNVINALRTGNQTQSPQFTNVPQQQNTSGANMLNAAQGQNQSNMGLYNAKMGAYNSNVGAATTAASTAGLIYALAPAVAAA